MQRSNAHGRRKFAGLVGALLLLWLAGTLWFPAQADSRQGFRRAWTYESHDGRWMILPQVDEGVLLKSFGGNDCRLQLVDRQGQQAWQNNLGVELGFGGAYQREQSIYVTVRNGGLICIGEDGRIAWRFAADYNAFESQLDEEPLATAEHYSRAGFLVYGVAADGSRCWTRLADNGFMSNMGEDCATLFGEYCSLESDYEGIKVWFPDGHRETFLAVEPVADAADSAPQPIPMSYSEPARLLGVRQNGQLLFSDGSKLATVDRDGTTWLDLPGFTPASRLGDTSIAMQEDHLLMTADDKRLVAFDGEFRQLWDWDPAELQVLGIQPFADGIILLAMENDNLFRSFSLLEAYLMKLRLTVQKSGNIPSRTVPGYSAASTISLLYIVNGEVISRIELGSHGAPRNVQLASDGGMIYLLEGNETLSAFEVLEP
ncbi:MAG: PQQ-binding-like beta-propeller repeat protein [bacterium]